MATIALLTLMASGTAWAGAGAIQVDGGSAKGELVLDGFPTGINAPGTLTDVPPGTHELSMEYGCLVGLTAVEVKSDETTKVTLKMENKGGNGTLRLRNLPAGAEIMVDNVPVPANEDGFEVKCGARNVTVEAPGYATWSQTLVVTTGKWTKVDLNMESSELEVAPVKKTATVAEVEEEIVDDDEAPAARSDYDDLDSPKSSSKSSSSSSKAKEEEEEEPKPKAKAQDDDLDEERPPAKSSSSKDKKDSKPFPVRGVVSGALAAGAVGSFAVTMSNVDELSRAQGYYTEMVQKAPEEAPTYEVNYVMPIRQKTTASGVATAVLAGGAVGAFLLIPGTNSDIAVVPTQGGGQVMVSFDF